MAILLILGGLVLMKLLSSAGRTWLAPWNGYLFAQVFLLGIAYLKLDPLMEDLCATTWLALILSGAAFFGGSILAAGVANRTDKLAVRSDLYEKQFLRLLRGILPILLVVFLVGVWIAYKNAGGWPVWMADPEGARQRFAWPGFVGVMFFQSIYCLALLGMSVWKAEQYWFWKVLGGISVLGPILVGVFSGMRFYAFLVTFTLILFLDVRKVIPFGRLLWSLIAMICVLMWVFLVRLGMFRIDAFRTGFQNLGYAKNIYLPLYQYVANNFWNLDWMFRLDDSTRSMGTTLGYSSFYGFLYPTWTIFPIDAAYDLERRFNTVLKLKSLNTTTYHGVLFMDFGWIGLAIVPGLLGFVATWAFQRARAMGGTFEALLASVLGFSVFFSFFTWIPRQPSFAFGLLMILILGRLARVMVSVRGSTLESSGAG